jgi:hypothetical protein
VKIRSFYVLKGSKRWESVYGHNTTWPIKFKDDSSSHLGNKLNNYSVAGIQFTYSMCSYYKEVWGTLIDTTEIKYNSKLEGWGGGGLKG